MTDQLPETRPGHWDTAEGRDMALEYLPRQRAELAYGHLSDLTLANAIFMVNRYDLQLIAYQEAAKQRIRWLSARLAVAESLLCEAREVIRKTGGGDSVLNLIDGLVP